jgi:DNA-binding response OmpR family regulator
MKKILIVDDSNVILRALSSKLTAEGYETLTAADGSQAVSIVRTERPDLILLDLGFPPDVAHGGGMFQDGFAIFNWLRRMDEGKDVPVIVITASKEEQFKKRSLQAGAIAYFQKPFDNDELVAAIRKAIG